jgi:hypothetical protein
LVVVGVGSIAASPTEEKEFWYYTDASKTDNCGYRFQFCSGSRWYGCETAYVDEYVLGSCGGSGGGTLSPWECRNGLDDDHDGWVDECIYGSESDYNP